MSNYSHVFQEFRPIVEQSNEDRLYFLEEDRWIGYPAANDLLDQLKGFLTLPKRSRMPNLLVLSKPNNGKTSIINQFFKLYGEGYVNAENNAVKPVIIVQAPVSPDEKALYMAILDKFWNTEDDYFASRSLDVFVTKLRKFLSEDESVTIKTVKGVGLILIEN